MTPLEFDLLAALVRHPGPGVESSGTAGHGLGSLM